MSLTSLLMSLVGPMVFRALTLLGIGTITFTGVTTALQGLIDIATNNWSSLTADVLALASIAGLPQAVGIITGAMTARVGMWVAVSATKWVLSPTS
jgi:Protein of unknown function (DUF2523)